MGALLVSPAEQLMHPHQLAIGNGRVELLRWGATMSPDSEHQTFNTFPVARSHLFQAFEKMALG